MGPSRFAMASPARFAHARTNAADAVGSAEGSTARVARVDAWFSRRGGSTPPFNRRAKERRLGRAAAPIGATTTKTTKKARERDAVLVGVGVGGFATERGRRERRRRR